MNDYFLLESTTKILLPKNATEPICNAAKILERDIKKTLSENPESGKSEISVKLAENSDMAPETFEISFSEDGISLNILGADELGAIYGLLYISRKYLGVTPFWFWNEQKLSKKPLLKIKAETYRSKPYYVRYRGFFVNDEVLLLGWHDTRYAESTWLPVFETLLRCGCNMVIPGTGIVNKHTVEMAASMGLIITHHHAEPLGAKMFLEAYPNEDPSFDKNPELFYKLWREAIINQKDHKVIWTLGFRGQGDHPFWEDDPSYKTPESRGKLISSIIKKQYDLICEYVENPVCCTNLYGEIMKLYKDGFIKIPDGIIKIWADNGYGKTVSRRQWNDNPRVYALPQKGESGKHGLYYHVTFHDLQASNHLTMLPNSPEFVRYELKKAFDAGATEYLILNCGNIRMHTYMLDLVCELWKTGDVDIKSHLSKFVDEYFSQNKEEIADCYSRYFDFPIKYGKNDDDHAGEQFYHYPVRSFISHWMKAKGNAPEDELLWMADYKTFKEQLEWYKGVLKGGAEKWGEFFEYCNKVKTGLHGGDAVLFSDGILLQALIHFTGAKGAYIFCEGLEKALSGDYLNSYMRFNESRETFKEGFAGMKAAQHGMWKGFYKNECLDNVSLTIDFLDIARKYVRMLGDDSLFLDWEKTYVWPDSEKRILLETTVTKQLCDDDLYKKLKENGI